MLSGTMHADVARIPETVDDSIDEKLCYIRLKQGCCSSYKTVPTSGFASAMFAAANAAYQRSTANIRASALAGNAEDCLEMGLRTYASAQAAGVNRTSDDAMLWWQQLTMMRGSTGTMRSVSRSIEARAWSCLAQLHSDRTLDPDGACNVDAMYRAADYADRAAALGLVTPAVLMIGNNLARYRAQLPTTNEKLSFDAPRFKNLTFLWEAQERREKEYSAELQQREVKTTQQPGWYICAAEGCGIEATKKSGLKQCSGACPAERKPRYCSKECQKQDWKRHKPSCKPGAAAAPVANEESKPAVPQPTSSLEGQDFRPADFNTSGKEYSISVPGPSGQSMKISSTTMSVGYMKEFRDALVKKHEEP